MRWGAGVKGFALLMCQCSGTRAQSDRIEVGAKPFSFLYHISGGKGSYSHSLSGRGATMNSVSQTRDDLMKHLSDHVGFMLASAKSFDEGNIREGKRLAGSMRVLLHDTSNSKSLLGQLSIKNSMGFYDTAKKDPREGISFIPLLLWIRMGPDGVGPQPLLDRFPPSEPPKKVPFDAWWKQVVLPVRKRTEFTRRDLVLAVANQDGGAHVDPKLDKRYAELTRHNALGWIFIVDGEEKSYEDPVLMTLRQIAYELLISLKDEFSDLFPQQTQMLSRFGQGPSATVDEAHVIFSKRA